MVEPGYVDVRVPAWDMADLTRWSFYRAVVAEFVATMLLMYIAVATIIGYNKESGACGGGGGSLIIAWAFGGSTFFLVYCTSGISGGHMNPVVTFALLLAGRLSIIRAAAYMAAQGVGAICGIGLVKQFMKPFYDSLGGGANSVAPGYSLGAALGAEIMGTFVLLYVIFSATDPKRKARDTHIPILAPLPIGFAVFAICLATIPITGAGINPARSFAAALVYNKPKVWEEMWIFILGPFTGALLAASYYQYIVRGGAVRPIQAIASYCSQHPYLSVTPDPNTSSNPAPAPAP